MLSVKDLQVYYGSIPALNGVSFDVGEGEIVSLIGANGAGKTTVLHTISGMIPAISGQVEFLGDDLLKIAPHKILHKGLAHVPEGRRVFKQMTVEENLDLGAYTRKDKSECEEDYKLVYEYFPRLKERRYQLAGTLSGGEQQMLAMGRAIMSRPKMMLMDEPSMGLAPIMVKEIFTIVKELNAQGITILLVEQNANMALSIAHRAYVLETGLIALSGTASELMHDEEVKKAYLGA